MKKVLSVALLVFVLISCSKEDRITRNLWSKSGTWEITLYTSMTGSENPSSSGVQSTYLQNCGKFEFGKDYRGLLYFTENGVTSSYAFNYTNKEDKITFYFDNSSMVEYDLEWNKNAVKLTRNADHHDIDGYAVYDNEIIVLAKK